MINRVRSATVTTAAIMVVYYMASMLLTRLFLSPDSLDLIRFALVLGLLQICLGLVIVRLMKGNGSYVPNEHRYKIDQSLFSVKFIWLFIVIKFGAVFVLLNDLQAFGELRKPHWVEFVLVIAFAATVGFFEEYLFRGMLFRNYLIALGDQKVVQAALVSALIFGMVHIDPTVINVGRLFLQLPTVFVAAGVGFYLAATYYKTGKMFDVIILHTLFNLSTFLLAPFLTLDLLPGFPTLTILPIGSDFGTYLPNLGLAALFFFFGYRILKNRQAERLGAIESARELEASRQQEPASGGQDVHSPSDMGNIEKETALGKDE